VIVIAPQIIVSSDIYKWLRVQIARQGGQSHVEEEGRVVQHGRHALQHSPSTTGVFHARDIYR